MHVIPKTRTVYSYVDVALAIFHVVSVKFNGNAKFREV